MIIDPAAVLPRTILHANENTGPDRPNPTPRTRYTLITKGCTYILSSEVFRVFIDAGALVIYERHPPDAIDGDRDVFVEAYGVGAWDRLIHE